MQEKLYSCLGGNLVLASRAAVPVTDRGFRFGDGVFETIRLVGGVPYQWELHLRRLREGLAALKIREPVTDWAGPVKKLLNKNRQNEGYLRLAVSRGSGSLGYMPYPAQMPASWVIEQLPALVVPAAPCRLWLSKQAKIPSQCLPVQHKLAQGVNSTLALLEAQEQACDEALQLAMDGALSEAASANLFWVKDDTVYTPSLETGCLSGTTRDALLRLSPTPIRTVRAGVQELEGADAVFLANCRIGAWPVSVLKPMDWKFPANPSYVKELNKLLAKDREAYRKKHSREWLDA